MEFSVMNFTHRRFRQFDSPAKVHKDCSTRWVNKPGRHTLRLRYQQSFAHVIKFLLCLEIVTSTVTMVLFQRARKMYHQNICSDFICQVIQRVCLSFGTSFWAVTEVIVHSLQRLSRLMGGQFQMIVL